MTSDLAQKIREAFDMGAETCEADGLSLDDLFALANSCRCTITFDVVPLPDDKFDQIVRRGKSADDDVVNQSRITDYFEKSAETNEANLSMDDVFALAKACRCTIEFEIVPLPDGKFTQIVRHGKLVDDDDQSYIPDYFKKIG